MNNKQMNILCIVCHASVPLSRYRLYNLANKAQSIPFAFKSKIASKSMEELRDICRKKGIRGYSKYGKKDLVDFIVKNLKKKSK